MSLLEREVSNLACFIPEDSNRRGVLKTVIGGVF